MKQFSIMKTIRYYT